MINISICIYSNKNFKIIKIKDGSFIVVNIDKDFHNGHTHIKNYYIAKAIIHACIYGEFPKKCKHLMKNKHILESLIRVCSFKYKNKFESYLEKIKSEDRE